MAGFTTDDSKAMLLDYLTGRAVAYTDPDARDTFLGLAVAIPDADIGLDTIAEVTTAGYGRMEVTWSAPSGSPVSITNSASIQFDPFTADMADAATYAFLTEVESGTGGTVLYLWQLVEPILAKANKPIFVGAGALTIQ